MKLLVIVFCLFSERYLVHAASHYRFSWFNKYFDAVRKALPQTGLFANPDLILTLVILPLLIISVLALFLFHNIVFGLVYLILNVIIFYYCLGPGNAFYPLMEDAADKESYSAAQSYFAQVNNQVFAVIFWYIVLGPLAVIAYRLISLSQLQESVAGAAKKLTGILDWITARLTVILYLLVGNFQQGFGFYTQHFFTAPENNDVLLGQGGLLAAGTRENDQVSLPYAQTLVEQALIVYLVFLAFFTLVAWL